MGQNYKKDFKVYQIYYPEKNGESPECDIGFVGCKSVKICVLAKLPDMLSNSANIEKNRIN